MSTGTPYKGLKVVELARILAGPWIGQCIADLGAEVIKVEAPGGDDTRRWGPPFIERDHPDGTKETVATYFHATNRGKTSVCADFRDPEDLNKVKALIAESDVVIENFKVGSLVKFGLDYDSLSQDNPGLIYASVTGFGQTGPRATQPGYDFLIQGMSGIIDVSGDPDGIPMKAGVAIMDVFTGLYGVIGVQAALAARAKSGKGQHIDLSLLDSGVGVLGHQGMIYLLGDQLPKRLGNGHPSIVPYDTYECSDGHLIIACGNDGQFRALARVLGADDWIDDPDFATNPARVQNRSTVNAAVNEKTKDWTKDDLIAALEVAKVPVGPINTVADVMADPQIQHRGMEIAPEGVRGIRTPLKFSHSELALDKAGPLLGTGKWGFKS